MAAEKYEQAPRRLTWLIAGSPVCRPTSSAPDEPTTFRQTPHEHVRLTLKWYSPLSSFEIVTGSRLETTINLCSFWSFLPASAGASALSPPSCGVVFVLGDGGKLCCGIVEAAVPVNVVVYGDPGPAGGATRSRSCVEPVALEPVEEGLVCCVLICMGGTEAVLVAL